jgi:2-polyprenyl-3-methyl-5-hydroxy-6-metoxy-1,4-benzoquinol methylase
LSLPRSVEAFQPRAHWAPDTPVRRLLFQLRLLADLQTNTIYRDLRRRLKNFSGKILDVGCGNSPFRPLLNPASTQYQGIDVQAAASFGYQNPDTIYYDGKVIPFADGSFDAVLCTEVLEHVADPAETIREIHRVLKPGGFGIITIPWSARFHYQPRDYHRYTPSMLEILFRSFVEREIFPRGTDFSSIASKVVVAYIRNLCAIKPRRAVDWLLIPFRVLVAVIAIPVLAGALLLGHAGIQFGAGSTDDPLGYTVVVKK